jgi:ankyrin repeat protein
LIGNRSIAVIGLSIVLDGIGAAGRRASATLLILLAAGAMCLPSAAQTGDKADALSEAARKGDAAAVKKLLDDGVDVNTKFRYNRTSLSFAADRGHVDVVKVLIDRGADPNIKDTFYGATPLAWAVSPAMDRTPKHTEVVRLLLAHGGIPADTLSDALAAATRNKLDDVVALLEKAGAKPK